MKGTALVIRGVWGCGAWGVAVHCRPGSKAGSRTVAGRLVPAVARAALGVPAAEEEGPGLDDAPLSACFSIASASFDGYSPCAFLANLTALAWSPAASARAAMSMLAEASPLLASLMFEKLVADDDEQTGRLSTTLLEDHREHLARHLSVRDVKRGIGRALHVAAAGQPLRCCCA
jgi:hypothetical protein